MDDFGLEQNVKLLIMTFSSKIDNIERAVYHTSEFVKSQNKVIDTFGLKLVLSEGITNAVVHGNNEDEKRNVQIRITITKKDILIRIRDMGSGFNWQKALSRGPSDPDDVSGRGFELIKLYGYNLSFNPKGNIMYLRKPLEPIDDDETI